MIKHPKIDMAFLKKRPLSKSSLTQFMKSPKHYIDYIVNGTKETKALFFGKLFDCLVLSPASEFKNRFAILPEDKKKHEEFKAKNKRKIYVTQADFDLAQDMKEAIFENTEAGKFIKGIKTIQRKLTFTDKATGLPMIGYADGDGMKDRQDVCVELKSGKDASKEGFERDAYYYNYPLQAAIYRKAFARLGRFPSTYYIVAEKTAPYGVNVFKATDDYLELGKKQLDDILVRFAYCMKNNLWHQGYEFYTAVGYAQLDLPYYAKKKLDE